MTVIHPTLSIEAPAPASAIHSNWPATVVALFTLAGLAAVPSAGALAMDITAFDVPEGLRLNETAVFSVTILNGGELPVANLTMTILDGNDTLATGAPAGLGAGQSRQLSFNVTIGGPAGENHSFTVRAGDESRSVTRFVERALLPASIVIDAVDVSPAERTGLAPGSTGVFQISVTLRNEGERRGTAALRIAGMAGAFANDTFTLDGGQSLARTYDWKVKGDRQHSAMATITGDVGSPSNMPASAELRYSSPAPGPGAMFVLAAFAAAAAMARARERGTRHRRTEG
jgi:hypothetical protein